MSRNKYPEETVKRIMDAAAILFMEKGYDKTSLQDIINATGLSKGAIYHHFASKEEIFVKICDSIGAQNAAAIVKVRDDKNLNGLQKLKGIFRVALAMPTQRQMLSMVPYLVDNPRFLAIQIQGLYEEVVPEYLLPILKEGVADGSIHTEHPRELAEVIMMLSNIWMHPLMQPTTVEAVEARCLVFKELMEGIGLDLMDQELIDTYVDFERFLEEHNHTCQNPHE